MEKPLSDNVQQQLLIEQRVANESKSQLVAYLLSILLWGLGVHRMYLGRWASGIIMLVLSGIGLLTAPILIGGIPLTFVWVWAVFDLFLIPGMVRNDQAVIRQRLMAGRW